MLRAANLKVQFFHVNEPFWCSMFVWGSRMSGLSEALDAVAACKAPVGFRVSPFQACKGNVSLHQKVPGSGKNARNPITSYPRKSTCAKPWLHGWTLHGIPNPPTKFSTDARTSGLETPEVVEAASLEFDRFGGLMTRRVCPLYHVTPSLKAQVEVAG